MALALGTRRSTAAAVASALAAMALAAAVAGRSCRVTAPGPEATVNDLVQAAKQGDRDTVYELLSPATRARLEAQAKRATDYVGGTVRYSAKDLISINTGDPTTPTDVTVIRESSDTAQVEIVSSAARARLELVQIDGRWRVDLPEYGAPAR